MDSPRPVSKTSISRFLDTQVSRSSYLSQQSFKRLESLYNLYTQSHEDLNSSEIWSFLEFCAFVIQRWWRKVRGRRAPVKTCPPRSAKGTSLSAKSNWHKRLHLTPFSEEDAAFAIQRTWHSYVNKQVFKYYQDLLNFKTRGDPAEFLRAINPREGSLVDPAAGTQVRFRLGGENFPPSIYYKIYTCGSVVDIGNFAPRYYTEPVYKKSHPLRLHNKGFDEEEDLRFLIEGNGLRGIELNDQLRLWYEREENNNWRLVSGQDLLRITCPVKTDKPVPVTKSSAMISRKEKIRRMRKKKRIQWLKLFKLGDAAEVSSPEDEMDKVVQSAARGMIDMAVRKGDDVIEDWEIDELLEWTNCLDFNDYLRAWTESGTSSNARDLRVRCVQNANLKKVR